MAKPTHMAWLAADDSVVQLAELTWEEDSYRLPPDIEVLSGGYDRVVFADADGNEVPYGPTDVRTGM
jgi:hypothetical protein